MSIDKTPFLSRKALAGRLEARSRSRVPHSRLMDLTYDEAAEIVAALRAPPASVSETMEAVRDFANAVDGMGPHLTYGAGMLAARVGELRDKALSAVAALSRPDNINTSSESARTEPALTPASEGWQPVGYMDALKLVRSGFDVWAAKEHNRRWFKKIDGTPIPNDLCSCIAEAVAALPAPPPQSKGQGNG